MLKYFDMSQNILAFAWKYFGMCQKFLPFAKIL